MIRGKPLSRAAEGALWNIPRNIPPQIPWHILLRIPLIIFCEMGKGDFTLTLFIPCALA